jgi:putative tryptophan/tyrosine transport system substrate-binding protein
MERRNLIVLLGVSIAAASPLPVGAQQKAIPVIGFLGSSTPGSYGPSVAALHRGLGEIGYVDGRNVAFEYRYAEGHYDRLPALAAGLVGRKVDVIVSASGVAAWPAKTATSTIPIVFTSGDDPVATGLVASLAKPGGNLTGISFLNVDLNRKRFELLSELVPQAGVVALLVNPNNSNAERIIREVQDAARSKQVQIQVLEAGTEIKIGVAYATLVRHRAGALVVAGDAFFNGRRDQLVALASRHAVPASYTFREFAEAGGLISYGTSFPAVFREAGIYAGKILKGAKAGELPVQQPTKFELVINLKTAKTLGLAVPQSLLARADEVIE